MVIINKKSIFWMLVLLFILSKPVFGADCCNIDATECGGEFQCSGNQLCSWSCIPDIAEGGCSVLGYEGICSPGSCITGAYGCVDDGFNDRCGYPAEFSSYGIALLVIGLIIVAYFLVKKRLK